MMTAMMKNSLIFVAFLLSLQEQVQVHGFSHSSSIATAATTTTTTTTMTIMASLKATRGIRSQEQMKSTTIVLYASENEEFMPETSFGAEVVPEGQRPVNEYLDMKRSPLFDWASIEVGTDGLLIRLSIVYAVVFGVVLVFSA
jgi:hypothetical protein